MLSACLVLFLNTVALPSHIDVVPLGGAGEAWSREKENVRPAQLASQRSSITNHPRRKLLLDPRTTRRPDRLLVRRATLHKKGDSRRTVPRPT